MFCVIPRTAFAAANKDSIFYGCSNFTISHFVICLLSIKMLHSANIFFNAGSILNTCQNKSAGLFNVSRRDRLNAK